MSVFKQSVAYRELAIDFIRSVLEQARGYKNSKFLAKKAQEQIELSNKMLEDLSKQKPSADQKEERKSLNGMKSSIRKYIKILESITNGLRSGTLPYKELLQRLHTKALPAMKEYWAHTHNFIPNSMDLTAIEDEIMQFSQDLEGMDMLKVWGEKERRTEEKKNEIREQTEKLKFETHNKQVQDLLEEFADESKNLPTTLGQRSFGITYMSVAPSVSNRALLTRKFLQKVKLDKVFIENAFVIFKNQTLLVFDTNKIRKEFIKPPKRKRDKTGKLITPKPSAKKDAEDREIINKKAEELVLAAVAVINRRSTTKYALASTQFKSNPFKPNIQFAWLLPIDVYRVFHRQASSGLNLKWGFPWSASKDHIL